MTKSLLVMSYYSNMPGACQAEWVDDRIKSFINEGYEISLISSICSHNHNSNKVNHYRVQSILPFPFIYEYNEIIKRKIEFSDKRFKRLNNYLKLSNFLNKFLTIFKGEGRWDWFISTLIWSIFNFKTIKGHKYIYTTGGPPSAHLLGVIYKYIFKSKLLTEFQDPLTGKDIGRNKFSKYGLKKAEKFLIKNADIIVYCTKNATENAKKIYSDFSKKIYNIYPGSSLDQVLSVFNEEKTKINLTYLGSLYQSRNLDNLMQAIRNLKRQNKKIDEILEINIYGNIDDDIKTRILNFELNIINYHGLIPRHEVIKVANGADVLLLIQNTDDRSKVTIPFKLYDYLALRKLTLGLTYKNEEIDFLLQSHGHLSCDASNVKAIEESLINLINNFNYLNKNIISNELTPGLAVKKMLKLYDL